MLFRTKMVASSLLASNAYVTLGVKYLRHAEMLVPAVTLSCQCTGSDMAIILLFADSCRCPVPFDCGRPLVSGTMVGMDLAVWMFLSTAQCLVSGCTCYASFYGALRGLQIVRSSFYDPLSWQSLGRAVRR